MSQRQFWIVTVLIALCAAVRLIEHPWNIAPMGALALFAGAHIENRKWAFVVPLAALLLGDIGLGAIHRNFEFWTFHALMPANYLCYAISVGLGLAVQKTWKRIDESEDLRRPPIDAGDVARNDSLEADVWRKLLKILPVAAATVTGGLVFFTVTNFAVWALYPTYPKTMLGLVTCYEKAIPFYRNTMLSDAFYVAVMFGGYAIARPVLEPAERRDLSADRG